MIEVWWGLAADVALGGEGLLGEREMARAERYRRAGSRERFVGARGLAKRAVAEVVGVKAEEVEIAAACRRCGSSEHGKPFAQHPLGTTALSISHSEDVVMVAISDGPDVGIDVEHRNTERWTTRLNRFVESRSQPEGIVSPERFYEVWTYKEAILKCTGDGLSVPMTSLSIQGDDGAVRLVGGPWDEIPAITVRSIEVPGPYAAAIAAAAPAVQVDRIVQFP